MTIRLETRQALEDHVKIMLRLLGLDTNSEGLKETPRRVISYLLEYRQKLDAEAILKDGFETPGEHSSMVIQSPLPFRMMCEHHLLPALGYASIGYIPGKRVIGLSKLPRLVDAVGVEKPSIQEAICDKIADILNKSLEPKGVIVTIHAEHSCMACRGVRAAGVITVTSSVRGVFRDVPQARAEFFALISGGSHG